MVKFIFAMSFVVLAVCLKQQCVNCQPSWLTELPSSEASLKLTKLGYDKPDVSMSDEAHVKMAKEKKWLQHKEEYFTAGN